MAAVQSLAGVSSGSGIAGIACQLASRSRQQQLGDGGRRRGRRDGGGLGVSRIRGQAAVEEGGGGGEGGGDDDFEARIAKLQRKVTSGTGKKAELRKARKEGGGGDVYAASGTKAQKKDSIFIPPVPLMEPVSDGLGVSLGITPYTERLHGRLAALGLAAVLLVELATGDSFVKFHDSGTLFVQVYTVVGLAAIFVKYEKERTSIWPKP